MIRLIPLLFITVLTFSFNAQAYSTFEDNADDSSTGTLDGKNGGSGWSGSWGAGSLLCDSDWVIGTGNPHSSPNDFEIPINTDASDFCERGILSPITTDNYSVSVTLSQSVTNNRVFFWFSQASGQGNTDGVGINLSSAGKVNVVDNAVYQEIGTYTANAQNTLHFKIYISTETFDVSLNGGATTTGLHLVSYNTTTYTSLGEVAMQDGADVTGGTIYIDNIGQIAPAGGGGGSSGQALNIASTSATTTIGEIGSQVWHGLLVAMIVAFMVYRILSSGTLIKIPSIRF